MMKEKNRFGRQMEICETIIIEYAVADASDCFVLAPTLPEIPLLFHALLIYIFRIIERHKSCVGVKGIFSRLSVG